MMRFILVVVIGLVGLASAEEDEALVNALSKRLLKILAGEELEKRGFYNVVRNNKGTKVYFQANSDCPNFMCFHTVLYETRKDGFVRTLTTDPGTRFVQLPKTSFYDELYITACEGDGKMKNCRFAILPAEQKMTMFSTSRKPSDENSVNQLNPF